jgi:hypothetical protein
MSSGAIAAPQYVSLSLMTPQVITSTFTGSAVDLLDYDGLALVVQNVGVVTAGTLTGKIQSSADGSTNWVDVTGALFTVVSASTNLQSLVLDLAQCQRFIRYVGTETGTNVAANVTVSAQKKIR